MINPTLLRRLDTAIVVVDLQEKLVPVIHESERVIKNARLLIEGGKILGVPVIVLEHYSKGLGATTSELSEAIYGCNVIQKNIFSACGCEEFRATMEELEMEQIVVCGTEAHICVLQTALDLLEHGHQVHVCADAIGSRAAANRDIALSRMNDEGAIITCVESALFELVNLSYGDEFKAISKLIK